MMMRINSAPAVLLCVVALSLGIPTASAAPTSDASAFVRGAHFSPDTPSVDVYLTSFAGGTTSLALSNVGYGDVSGYQRIAPGLYSVGMRPAGADPATPVVISWTLDAKAGEAFTAYAIGMNKALQGRVATDDLTPPPPGQARVRIVEAASRTPTADIVAADGPVLGTAVPFGTTTGYTTVPAGSWPVTARSVDDPKVATTANVTLTAGRISTVVLLDGPQGGISLRTVDDAIGDNIPPTGPVAAGGGSTAITAGAGPALRTPALALTGLALALTVALLGVALRRTDQHT